MNMINRISINKLIRFIKLKSVYDAIKYDYANSKQLILNYLKTFLFAEKGDLQTAPKTQN